MTSVFKWCTFVSIVGFVFLERKNYEEAIELYVAGGHIADFIHMMCSVLYLKLALKFYRKLFLEKELWREAIELYVAGGHADGRSQLVAQRQSPAPHQLHQHTTRQM